MSKNSVYCAPCRFFGPQSSDSREKAFGTTPVSDWSNLGKLIQRHENTKSHQNSLLSADKFIAISEGKDKDIACNLSEGHDVVVSKNREILKCIIDTIILCGNQNFSLRGHKEEQGNFMALLRYRSQDNSLLAEHLDKCSQRKKYTSPEIQNELIGICGDIIVNDIISACNKSPCFGFIADEATDAATIEQMALCVRFYDEEQQSIREEFIGFAECSATTGEALTEDFLQNLTGKGVDIQKMRAQGYDGAANMSGRHRGVQARVRSVIPGAIYTHCKAHNLNLSIVHACKEAIVRNVMDTIQEIAFAFDYSAKKLLKFKETLQADEIAKREMERRQKLQTLCETRWASRADALYTFKSAFSTVYGALGTLAETDSKARNHQNAIAKFDFIVTLVATEHVLSALIGLSKLLQKKDCDLCVAVEESKVVISQLQGERNDPMVWDTLFESAVELAASVNVEPALPRIARAQLHRPNAPAVDASTYFRLNMYLPFLDHLLQELNDRLINAQPRYKAQYLLPSKVSQMTDVIVDEVYDTYGEDLNETKDLFCREVQRWKHKWEQYGGEKPASLQDTLAATNRDLYPSVFIVLSIFACMPVSTATAERSFSTMRRVKTYLRATMTTERLSGLGLLNVYREKKIEAEQVLDIFTRKKNRKLALIFDN